MSDDAATDVRLRAATASDAEFLAWGLDEAAGGLFTAMFGGRAPEILATVISEPAHEFSFEHAVVAQLAGSPVGFCQGMPYGTPGGSAGLMRAAGIRSIRAGVVALLAMPVLSALGRHAPGDWYLQAIAVRPVVRGSGVGRALFADAFERAGQSGCHRLTLDVEGGNTRARALYERLGLRVQSSSRKAVLLNGVRVHRMSAVVPAM